MATVSEPVDIKLPDLGDFEDVEIIDIAVNVGDEVDREQALLTLESDKASMDIPSPQAGIITDIHVKVGDRVRSGDRVMQIKSAGQNSSKDEKTAQVTVEKTSQQPAPASRIKSDSHAEVLVLGAGPGGYTAAFRAADLGKQVVLVERFPTLGGVCLNVGCIPSKAMLHVARVITEIEELRACGIDLGQPEVAHKPVREWTENVVGKLTTGLKQMARQRGIKVIQGIGKFSSPNSVSIKSSGGMLEMSFEHAVIAAGSTPSNVPGMPEDLRILNSTTALLLESIPERLLVIGGGIIGMEMATIYAALGSRITIVEMLDGLITGADRDLVRPLEKRAKKHYENVYTGTAVKEVIATDAGIKVNFDGKNAPASDTFDAVLVAVGRIPNGKKLQADKAGIHVDERGFIPVDDQQRTNVTHIFAIGDIVGQPMLAHKATHEGKIAAEVIAGLKSGFDNRCIPSVAYTDPEIAWVGVTEDEARERNIDYGTGMFPWAANGRSLTLGRDEGLTKLIFDRQSGRVIGVGITGPNAGDLISEGTLAVEMGCDAGDIGLTIHPHPTLSETVGMAAEMYEGTITDLYLPKK